MHRNSSLANCKRLDSYSMLICSKYLKKEDDYINIICVCKKFKETTEKLRYNPIPINSLKLFPKIQTQYLYSSYDVKITGMHKYKVNYDANYNEYLNYKKLGSNVNTLNTHKKIDGNMETTYQMKLIY